MKSAVKTARKHTHSSAPMRDQKKEETLQNLFKYCPSLLLLFYRYIFINYI